MALNHEQAMQQNSHSTFVKITLRHPTSTKYAFFSTTANPTTFEENQTQNHCNHEPEYLEIVTQTAERMKSAVRAYIAEHSSNNNGERSNNIGNPGYIIDSHTISKKFNTATSINHSTNNSNHFAAPIKLVGILATTTTSPPKDLHNHHCDDQDTHGNERYSEHIANSCSADGILYEPWRVPPTREAVERAILHANERLDVHGILVFYPVFDKLVDASNEGAASDFFSSRGPSKCENTGVYYKSMDDYFRDLVVPEKDVEGHRRRGLRLKSIARGGQLEGDLVRAHESDRLISCITPDSDLGHANKAEKALGPIHPCTALACFRILESFRLDKLNLNKMESKRRLFEDVFITIINRSEVLGLPLATMLASQGATVYSADIDSILQFLPNGKVKRMPNSTTLKHCVMKSSMIVSGVPSCTFCIPTAWIPENATVVNVATEKSNFDEETLENVPGVTYVPHVGRVTVSALEYNLICLHRSYHRSI